MAASVKLLVPQLPVVIATLSFTTFIILSEVLIPYSKYVKILKYLTISLLAYVATAIIVGGNFKDLLLIQLETSELVSALARAKDIMLLSLIKLVVLPLALYSSTSVIYPPLALPILLLTGMIFFTKPNELTEI